MKGAQLPLNAPGTLDVTPISQSFRGGLKALIYETSLQIMFITVGLQYSLTRLIYTCKKVIATRRRAVGITNSLVRGYFSKTNNVTLTRKDFNYTHTPNPGTHTN